MLFTIASTTSTVVDIVLHIGEVAIVDSYMRAVIEHGEQSRNEKGLTPIEMGAFRLVDRDCTHPLYNNPHDGAQS